MSNLSLNANSHFSNEDEWEMRKAVSAQPGEVYSSALANTLFAGDAVQVAEPNPTLTALKENVKNKSSWWPKFLTWSYWSSSSSKTMAFSEALNSRKSILELSERNTMAENNSWRNVANPSFDTRPSSIRATFGHINNLLKTLQGDSTNKHVNNSKETDLKASTPRTSIAPTFKTNSMEIKKASLSPEEKTQINLNVGGEDKRTNKNASLFDDTPETLLMKKRTDFVEKLKHVATTLNFSQRIWLKYDNNVKYGWELEKKELDDIINKLQQGTVESKETNSYYKQLRGELNSLNSL
ncbi:MAG: hypothetical protein K2W99_04735 [Chthoniobacterales bacterium]|nr:hypothetical protein [Chthoniobacterales bacterium]